MMSRALAVAAILVLPCTAGAQTAGPVQLSLADAIARGLAASQRLVEAGTRVQAAEAGVTQRHAAALPQVNAIAGYTRTNHITAFGVPAPDGALRVIYPDIPDNYRLRLDVGWSLYNGGRTRALEDAARRDVNASGSDAEALRADLRLEVTRAFWALFVADESRRVVGEALARTSAHVANVRSALDAGLVPPNDLLTAQAQESRQRMLSVQAAAAREVAELELAKLVGLPPGTPIQPVEALTASAPPDDAGALQSLAAGERDDRRAVSERIAAASLREQAALAGRRPNISVAGGFDYANPNPRIFPRQGTWQDSWDASVNVTWPLFNGGRTAAEVAEANAVKRGLEARLSELDATVALEIRQRLADLRASEAAIAAAEDAVRAATEALRVVNDRYAAGVAISTDVLDAQVVLLQASLDRTQALVGARLAAARLDRATGQ